MSDILSFILWYVTISALGWIAFPIAFRFFPKLASKGYAVAKPLGLLIWGYGFWLLCTLGVLQNNLGGQLVALAILIALSGLALSKGKGAELKEWVKANWKSVVTIEAVFLVFFALWAVVRAANPDIVATEKPMELAFINSILRSPTFPPQDPWLSGYAISYYYFGYILIAMLIRITGVVSGVGYNLTAALWFAMTTIAAFGMVFDLIAFWKRGREGKESTIYSEVAKATARFSGLLGSIFVLIVSNLEGLLEILSGAGLFWTKGADGLYTSKFWSWLAIQDINVHEEKALTDYLGRFWAWWRGSRVLQDFRVSGASVEIIDEFPFFSYLLSDLHPHVLAMPFDLLAMAIALNLFIAGSEALLNWSPLDWLKRWEFLLTALILGSMAFLNTWDFPIYVGLFCLVLLYIRIRQAGWSAKRIGEFLVSGLLYGVTGVVLFLPFFVAFKSQAGGFLPSLEFVTRGAHFWVMFAPLLIPIFAWLIYLWRQEPEPGQLRRGGEFALYLVGGLWVLSALIGLIGFSALPLGNQLIYSANPSLASLGQKLIELGTLFGSIHDSTNGSEALAVSLQRRAMWAGTWVTLLVLLGLLWAQLSKGVQKATDLPAQQPEAPMTAHGPLNVNHFVLILILIGAGLTLFPEFFYLRDMFGSRMNTIFKFYFQAWIFWGIAAATVTVILWSELRDWKRSLFGFVWLLVFAGALCYPAIMLVNKTDNFKPAQWTLDGNAYIGSGNPDEALAEDWLLNAPMGVLVEAVGGSYQGEYARISTHTGLPTVLGWPGHEQQWRGGYDEVGSRESDIRALYETNNWFETLSIITRYQIRYIYVGSSERIKYEKLSTEKFANNLPVAYSNNSVTIYEVPMSLLDGTP